MICLLNWLILVILLYQLDVCRFTLLRGCWNWGRVGKYRIVGPVVIFRWRFFILLFMIIFWNIRGLGGPSKCYMVSEVCKRSGADVVCLEETKLLDLSAGQL